MMTNNKESISEIIYMLFGIVLGIILMLVLGYYSWNMLMDVFLK